MPFLLGCVTALAVAAVPPPKLSLGAAQAGLQSSPPPAASRPELELELSPRQPEPVVSTPPSPVRVRWAIDSAVIVSAVVPYMVLAHHHGPRQTVEAPSAPPDVGRFDRAALGHYRPAASTVSDGLVAVSLAMPALVHGVESGVFAASSARPGRTFAVRYASDLVMYGEAIALDLLAVKVLKLAVRRHRPFSHLDPDEVPANVADELTRAQGNPSRSESFPSGHASLAFTAATAGSTLLTLKHGRKHPGLVTAVWLTSTSLAATTAALRVVAGKHYPTDVLAGSLIGAALGVAVPLAHAQVLRRRRDRDRDRLEPPRSWRASLQPSFAPGGGSVMFSMQW